MLVKEVMKREVVVVGPDTWLVVAACMMRDEDVGCLPVVEDGRLIGMITDRDIAVRGVAEGLDPHRTVVREAMSSTAFACSDEDTVEHAREVMATNLIKHLPVLDRHEQVVGLVSQRDISGRFGRSRPYLVTFYKSLANSSGHVGKVEVGKVYLSRAIGRDDLVPAALAKFARDRSLGRWDRAADAYEIEEGC